MFAGAPWHAGGVAAKNLGKKVTILALQYRVFLAPPRGCSLLTKALISLAILILPFVFRDTQAL